MSKYYDCPLEAAYMAKNFGVKIGMFWNDSEETYECPVNEIVKMFDIIINNIFVKNTLC